MWVWLKLISHASQLGLIKHEVRGLHLPLGQNILWNANYHYYNKVLIILILMSTYNMINSMYDI